MASAPLFKQRKSKSTQRSRTIESEPTLDVPPVRGEDPAAMEEAGPTLDSAALKAKIKSRTTKKKADTRLSFDADPEQKP
jgi:hypothetical protein